MPAFSLCNETGTCPQFEVHIYCAMKVIEREMNCLEKPEIIKTGLTGYSFPVLLVTKHQHLYTVCKALKHSMINWLKLIMHFHLSERAYRQ